MGLAWRGASAPLIFACAAACSGHGAKGSGLASAQGGEPPASGGGGNVSGGAVAVAGSASSSGGTAGASTMGGAAAGVAGTGGAPASGGSPGEPPLVVSAVDQWGGQPLGMVPFATSGSRLQAVGYTDGSAVFFKTMHDTKLDTDCTFEKTEAGDWLCTPTKQQPLIYLDSACTDPAVEEPAYSMLTGQFFSFLNPSFSNVIDLGDAVLQSTHSPVYRVGEELFASDGTTTYAEDSMSLYEQQLGRGCVGPRMADRHVVVTPPSIFRAAAVPDSELVKASARPVPLNDGLTLRRLVTDDGAQLSGYVELAGKPCELEWDGRCVPTPVAKPSNYADPDCKEMAFSAPRDTAPGATLLGVEPAADHTSLVFELTPITTVYLRKTRYDMVMMDGQTMLVEVFVSCDAEDFSGSSFVTYRRVRDVTNELPKLDTVELGAGTIFPNWLVGTLSGTDTKVQVQMHSPDFTWVTPNARIDGSVCAVYDNRYVDQCLAKEGTFSLPVTEVDL